MRRLFSAAVMRGVVLAFGIGLLAAQVVGPADRPYAALIRLVAPAFFLFALWAAVDVLAALEKGRDFDAAMTRSMGRAGAGLMLGAWACWLFQPMMLHLIGNGFLQARGVSLDYSVQNLTLAAVGLILILVARRGRALRDHVEAFV